jgi:hypothetical protein
VEDFDVTTLEAVQMAKLAYVPGASLEFLQHESAPGRELELNDEQKTELAHFKDTLPQGWRIVPRLSHYGGTDETPDRNNQIVTFVNDARQQCVLAFKGSNNLQNFRSDILDDGGREWESVRGNVQTILEQKAEMEPDLEGNNIKDYTCSVTGHSLGGGMAQTCAVLHGMPGHAQNPLPVSTRAIEIERWGSGEVLGERGFEQAATAWAQTHRFINTRVKDDIANAYYHDFKHGRFVHTHVLDLPHYTGQSQAQLRILPARLAAMLPDWLQSVLKHTLPNRVLESVDAHMSDTIIRVTKQLDAINNTVGVIPRQATFLTELAQATDPLQQPSVEQITENLRTLSLTPSASPPGVPHESSDTRILTGLPLVASPAHSPTLAPAATDQWPALAITPPQATAAAPDTATSEPVETGVTRRPLARRR